MRDSSRGGIFHANCRLDFDSWWRSLCSAAGLDARAQARRPPRRPRTPFGSFLGIPQGINKIKDATKNKNGNHPEKERKPPLKRIADPANLESQNPAIKAAAKVKAEEDLAPQKIKAIKYLATIGCGCYPGVKEALLAALDDCTEEVRYQAAIALCEAAGSHCEQCGKTCCNAEVMSKLEEKAHGQDDERLLQGVVATGASGGGERLERLPTEASRGHCSGRGPTEEGTADSGRARRSLSRHRFPSLLFRRQRPRTRRPLGPTAVSPTVGSHKGRDRGVCGRCDSGQHRQVLRKSNDENPQKVAEAVAMVRCPTQNQPRRCLRGYETTVCPEEKRRCPRAKVSRRRVRSAPAAPSEQPEPPSNALAGNFGAASGPTSAAPNMIGDLFGSGGVFVQNVRQQRDSRIRSEGPRFRAIRFRDSRWRTTPARCPRTACTPITACMGACRSTTQAIGVNSFAPGFEKTFFDGRMSFEMRAPMANTLDHNIFFDNTTRTSVGELGDLGMVFKMLLLRNEQFAFSGGLAMTVPTSPDERFYSDQSDSDVDVLMKSESVHLMPFFGFLWTPNDRWFSISYLQVDVDANGTPVSVDTDETSLTSIGRYRERDDDVSRHLIGLLGLSTTIARTATSRALPRSSKST